MRRSLTLTLTKENPMWIVAWLILGIFTGFVGSRMIRKSRDGMIGDVLLGAAGAVAGGYLFAASSDAGFTLWSFAVALMGSVLALYVKYGVIGQVSASAGAR
jgi:uncharacterized membrane protein YeaQ/YmgE (transglycosylase-associated protein family)